MKNSAKKDSAAYIGGVWALWFNFKYILLFDWFLLFRIVRRIEVLSSTTLFAKLESVEVQKTSMGFRKDLNSDV